jgi:peptidoglycan LD-endopeptidase CwlK
VSKKITIKNIPQMTVNLPKIPMSNPNNLVLPAVDHYNLLRRIDVNLIYPPVLNRIRALLENCARHGVLYHATHGTRTYPQQAELYAQGRTKPGNIVTNARPGHSLHNFGLAIDLVFDTKPHTRGLYPNWDKENYDLLAQEAVKLDLEPGHLWQKFRDSPHVQLPIGKQNLTITQIREKFEQTNKYADLWAWLDTVLKW